jgi:DNA modification methylase
MNIQCAYDEIIELHKLQPNPNNPNKHPEEQINLLAKIIDYQGQRSPIVVSNRSGFITKGHGRLLAIQKLGWEKCAVDFQDYESEAQEYADMVADNKIAELAEHDDAMMIDYVKINDLKSKLPSLDLLGMPNLELPDDPTQPQCDEDEVPEKVEPKTKPGDVYVLGKHRLICGSAVNIEDVKKLMGDESADCVITDPPYNVSVNDESEESLKARNRRTDGLKIQNDKMGYDNFIDFLRAVFASYYSLLKSGGTIYVFYADSMTIPFLSTFCDSGFHFAQNCIWNKQQFVMTRKDYHYKHEPIIYVWKDGAAHEWFTDRKQSSVWNFDRPFKSELHPTMKPINLLEYPINNSSKTNSLVVDLFGGSGSTMIACEKLQRKCYMMEIDPHYCDVIVARWEKYTGKKAELING